MLLDEPIDSMLYDLVKNSLERQSVQAEEMTECYLVGLLGAFLRCEPEQFSRALGVEMVEAASLEPALRYLRLKDLADTTLFLSGIFIDHIEAMLPATDYFFDIGSSAYLDLVALEERHSHHGPGLSQAYKDLGRRFEEFSGVLASIADRRLWHSNQRLLGLYRRWVSGGEARLERRLLALGLIPVRDGSSEIH